MARGGKVIPYSRSYRKPPRWGMGLPPRRPAGRLTRLLRRIVNPLVYLKAVMLAGLVGLVLLPQGADLVTAATKPAQRAEGDCRVLAVIDGDTVTLACPDLGVVRARLLGLDAPEKYSPGCGAELIAAERATWALRGILLQAEALAVTFEGEDRYGRALVRLRADGEDVARRMVREGHARAYGGGLRGSWC
jgi:endonuclease YncB( thermonuclease family)